MKDLLNNYNVFINYLNYECKDNEYYEINDVQTGENFKKHMLSMNENFKQFQNSSNVNAKEAKMINICLSEFYDGIQIRKTKIQTFWPLLVTILNFPPDIRNKLGIGMFVLSIFTASQNTESERFILEYCFAKELEQFYEGIIIKTESDVFFVQIRLIFMLFVLKSKNSKILSDDSDEEEEKEQVSKKKKKSKPVNIIKL
jgi:hypothetical protein